MFAWLQSWADSRKQADLRRDVARLQRDLADVRQELGEAESRVAILELERDRLLEVCERDRLRVGAEAQAYAQAIATAEKKPTRAA